MSLHKTDDHYNQSRYKYEGKGSHFQTIQEGQRWNYPFLFNRKSGFRYPEEIGYRLVDGKWEEVPHRMMGRGREIWFLEGEKKWL